jgi:hypothetical protein
MRNQFILMFGIIAVVILSSCVSEKPTQKVELSFKEQGNV